MSAFNGDAFLAEAVESILAQTVTDFEFIIIDDGSTDKTPEILSMYAKRDARVRVFQQENRGRAESLNRGIELSRSRYIARMDADDIALPDRLNEQVNFLVHHPEVGLLGGAYELVTGSGRLRTVRPPLDDPHIRTLMLRFNPICHPTVMMRKDLVLASGGYRKALLDADDYDLWLRIGERSRLANLDKVVLQYRLHPRQVSVQNMRHQTFCVLAARAAAKLRRNGDPDPLSGIQEINAQLLEALGIAPTEIHQALVDVHLYWIDILRHGDAERALQFAEGLLRLSASQRIERAVLADAWLKAAGIQYEQGRLAKALFSTGRGILLRPIIIGRPIKRVFARLATVLGA